MAEQEDKSNELPKTKEELAALLEEARLDGAKLMAATIGHYLGNSINPILGLVDLIAVKSDMPESLKALTSVAQPEVANFRRLLHQVQQVKRLVIDPKATAAKILDLEASVNPPEPERKPHS